MDENRYELWEYHGPIDKDDLRNCGCEVDDDPMAEHHGIVVFLDNRVIKADINPLETGESIFSILTYEDDETSVFGFGVPYIGEHEQRIANAAWRMNLDNAAYTVGPQIVISPELITPADGAWDLKAGKIWWLNDTNYKADDAFSLHNIDSHQAELTTIYEMAKGMMDDVTNLPMLAQGDEGDAPDTALGTSMLMNSANVVPRRIVKQYDDNVTKTMIGRFYDWNMQNSDKHEIKGDFEVDARGSSTLLVKETQTAALLEISQISQQEAYADWTKFGDLYRKIAQAQHITPAEIIYTDEEYEANIKRKADQGGMDEGTLKQMEMQQEVRLKEMDMQYQAQQKEQEMRFNITKLSMEQQQSEKEIQARMAQVKLVEDNKANLHMSERQHAQTIGQGRGL